MEEVGKGGRERRGEAQWGGAEACLQGSQGLGGSRRKGAEREVRKGGLSESDVGIQVSSTADGRVTKRGAQGRGSVSAVMGASSSVLHPMAQPRVEELNATQLGGSI